MRKNRKNILSLIHVKVNKVYKFFKNLFLSFCYKIYFFNLVYLKNVKYVYLGSINHGNLGDQAIAVASLNFLKNIKAKAVDVPMLRFSSFVEKTIKKRHLVICLRGGGNICDDWIDEECFHRDVIQKFPDNKIVFFPESIHFNDSKEAEKTSLIYNRHSDLTVCCRDEYSYNYAKTVLKLKRVIKTPDIVFSLKTIKLKEKKPLVKVGIILRKDIEQANDNSLFVKQSLDNQHIKYSELSTIIKKRISQIKRKKEIYMFFNKLQEYDLVITDRLHAMIFCFLLSIPCIVYNNSTNKVFSSFEWIKDCGFIKKANQVNFSNLKDFFDNVNFEKKCIFNEFDSLKKAILS